MTYSEGERGKERKKGKEKEKEREGERKGERKGKGRERGKEREREKTGDGFVITESFSYLCMRDRYLETDKQDKHCPPCT